MAFPGLPDPYRPKRPDARKTYNNEAPCWKCGCKLSRIRYVPDHHLASMVRGALADWVWGMFKSKCRRCGEWRNEWKDKGYAAS